MLSFVTVLVLGLIELMLSSRKVPSLRPYVAILRFLGIRTSIILGAGWKFLPWPFFDFIPVYVGIRNQTVVAEAYSAKEDRIKFKFKVNVHWLPDYEIPGELENYIQAGGASGLLNFSSEEELAKCDWQIRQKLEDIVKEVVKNFASSHGADQCLNVKDEIYERLISRLTGITDKAELKALIEKFKGKDRIRLSERWGIIIDSLYVEPVHPTPEMEKILQQKAKEERERVAELIEIDTELEQARKILAAAGITEMNREDLIEALRFIKDYKTVREGHGFVIPGRTKSGGAVDDFLQVLTAYLHGHQSGKKSEGDGAAEKSAETDKEIKVRRKK